jgi:hypothetical protein
MNTFSVPSDQTHAVQQHKQSTVQVLRYLSAGVQQLTNLFESNSNTFLSSDTSDLIAQLYTALVSLKVEQLQQQAISQGIYDFFPTPLPLIEKMLKLAQLEPGMKVLEPSAGSGHICREAKKLGVEPDCFEISPLLRRGLLLQGFNVVGENFLANTPSAVYDRILANPPFSRNGVARHTLRALDWLRPGGRLVTVAHHYQLQPSTTDRAFFQWLKGFNSRFYDCGQAFQHGDRPCNVAIQLIVIEKPCW